MTRSPTLWSSARWTLAFFAVIGCLVPRSGTAMTTAQADPPTWVVDPARPGDNLPPAGRSLFDRLFAARGTAADTGAGAGAAYDIPFPFAALLARLDAQLRPDPNSTLPPAKRVLIPLGRSLQRNAAAPDYFDFPRVVVAIDAPPASSSALLLKDRLYIGYQEKSDVLEVISYNETAARFEFQLVRNYRAGGTPQVTYARRTLCFACHQNGAPIFSRALWDETNANPKIAAQLAASGKDFYGVSPARGVDLPYAIDIGIKRANDFALTQRLWADACGGDQPDDLRCRAGLFAAALRHALSDGRKGSDDAEFTDFVDAPLRARAARLWPGGLAVGTPDIANRNPMQGVEAWPDDASQRVLHAHVPARFEPLALRPARDIWRAGDADAMHRLLTGLAEFVAATDRQRLASVLAASALASPTGNLRYQAACRIERHASRWSVRCQPANPLPANDGPRLLATLDIRQGEVVGGRLERLSLPASGVLNGVVLSATPPLPGEHAALVPDIPAPRGADGNPLARVVFELAADDADSGRVVVEIRPEFALVEQALDSLARGADGPALFGAHAFPRESLFAALFVALGAPQSTPAAPWCRTSNDSLPARSEPGFERHAAMPTAVIDKPANSAMNLNAAAANFFPYCATCHQSDDAFPPNFLSGSDAEVTARLHQCAPRLFVRLAMADVTPEQRDKTPMPPESLLPAFGSDIAAWRASPARAGLLAQVSEWLRAESGHAPRIEQLLAGGYEALRPCLPAPSTMQPRVSNGEAP